MLTIVIPVYNEEECLTSLYNRLLKVAELLPCKIEFLFVNDGSTDNSLSIIHRLQQKDSRISIVDLSRNFGKEKAMCAGIDHAKGNALTILDADLQDPPELIPQMWREIENGYDDVYACRTSRKEETRFKCWSAKTYYRWLHYLSDIPIQEDTGDFRMFSEKTIRALRQLKESERNMKGLFSYIGLKKKAIYYERDPRIAGRTKWNYLKLFDLAIKGFTSFSILPLRFVSFLGGIVSIVAFIYLMVVVCKALLYGDPVAGYPSLMAVQLFLGGSIMLALGIIGEYLGIVYNETKKRPIYYVNEYLPMHNKNKEEKKSVTTKLMYHEKFGN